MGEGFLEEVAIEHPTLRMSRGVSRRCYRQREKYVQRHMVGKRVGLSCDKEKILRCSKLNYSNLSMKGKEPFVCSWLGAS